MTVFRDKIEDGRIGKLSGYAKYVSFDKQTLYVQVFYFCGKFTIEKYYTNSSTGRADANKFIKQFKKDEDILKHFKIKGPLKMSLDKIVEEIKTQREYASENPEEGNPSTQNFRVGRKNSAIENLSRLEELYKENLKKNLIAVVVNGSDASEFGTKAKELVEMPSISYSSLIDIVMATFNENHLEGKSSIAAVVDRLNDSLSEIDDLIDADVPLVEYKTSMDKSLKTMGELRDFITSLIDKNVGNDILTLFAIEKACQEALDMLYEGKRFAFTLPISDPSQADEAYNSLSRIVKSVFMVVAGRQGRGLSTEPVAKLKDTNEESVMEALKAIKESIK